MLCPEQGRCYHVLEFLVNNLGTDRVQQKQNPEYFGCLGVLEEQNLEQSWKDFGEDSSKYCGQPRKQTHVLSKPTKPESSPEEQMTRLKLTILQSQYAKT